jgi:hypothetical protein
MNKIIAKSKNWISQVKTVQTVNKELVLRKLNISEAQYVDMVLDGGFDYLRNVLELDEELVQDLVSSSLFWKWWMNHWQKWDAEFLIKSRRENPRIIQMLYNQLHDPSDKGYAPNKKLLKAMLAEAVVDKLIEEES